MIEIKRLDDKCTNCMLCVRDCIAAVWREVDGRPEPVAPLSCSFCSHCLAVCPSGAISHSLLDVTQIVPVNKKNLNAEAYRNTVVSRRSLRHFKKKPVPREVLQDIIDCARYSPTASNSQNVEYIVVTNPEIIEKTARHIFDMAVRLQGWINSRLGKALLEFFKNTKVVIGLNRYLGNMDYYREQTRSGRDFVLHRAPVLILICAPKRTSFAVDNCAIVATNISNYAHTLGLGSCHVGFLTVSLRYSRRLRKMLKLPAKRQAGACLVLGYPAFTHSNTASRAEPQVRWID